MAYEIECNDGGANTALPKCRGDYGRDLFYILVPPGAEIADQTTAETEGTWTDAIEDPAADRWHPFPQPFRYAPSREDHVYSQGDFGEKVSIREGYADGVAHYKDTVPCFRKNLVAFNNQRWKAYIVTSEGFIRGWSSDGTKFEPFDIEYHVEADIPASGEEKRLTPIRLFETKAWQWGEKGQVINPVDLSASAWDPRDLEGLLDVTVEKVGDPTGDEIIVDVQGLCDNQPITGLVVADFVCEDDTPSDEPLDTCTESTTIAGRYTLVPTSTLGADNYTINLNEPSAMTTNGYQCGDDETFTISI